MAGRTLRIELSLGFLLAGLSLAPAQAPPADREAAGRAGEGLGVLEPLVGEWIIRFDGAPGGDFNRSTFQWKGGKSCLQYKSFRTSAGAETPQDEGLFVWDFDKRAIRELTVDASGGFTSGVWTPDGAELVGEFEVFGEGGRAGRHRLLMEFVDKNTIKLWPVIIRDGQRMRGRGAIVFRRKGAEAQP